MWKESKRNGWQEVGRQEKKKGEGERVGNIRGRIWR